MNIPWKEVFFILCVATCFLVSFYAEEAEPSETHEILVLSQDSPARYVGVLPYGSTYQCTEGGLMMVDAFLWIDVAQRDKQDRPYTCFVRAKGYYNESYNL